MNRGIIAIAACMLSPFLAARTVNAADLEEVRARGVLRHLGVPYANFVTGAGDGMDVEMIQAFAKSLGLTYAFVQTDWGTVLPDLTGKTVKVVNGHAELQGNVPAKGDLVANGFTMLPWRQEVVSFSAPTFPSQIWLVARADSKVRPIAPTGDIHKDIELARALMKNRTVLTLDKTCLEGDSEIYQRIVFLNVDGTPIVDSRPDKGSAPDGTEPARWAPLLAEESPSLKVLGDELVLVAPYQFKSRPSGHVLAWLSVKRIYQHLVGLDDAANHTIALAFASRLLFVPKGPATLVSQEAFPDITSLPSEGPRPFTAPAAKDKTREMLAFRTLISGTPLALVTIIPASKLGGISPLLLVAVTGSVGILVVLLGMASVIVHRRALQTMEQLFQKMPFGIVVLAKDRNIGLANEAAGAILACTGAELKGRPWAVFVPDTPREKQPTALEVTAVDARAKSRIVLLTEIPATIGGQEVFLEAFVDRTDMRRLEARRNPEGNCSRRAPAARRALPQLKVNAAKPPLRHARRAACHTPRRKLTRRCFDRSTEISTEPRHPRGARPSTQGGA